MPMVISDVLAIILYEVVHGSGVNAVFEKQISLSDSLGAQSGLECIATGIVAQHVYDDERYHKHYRNEAGVLEREKYSFVIHRH